MATLCSCIIYFIGAIITGIAYRVHSVKVECKYADTYQPIQETVFLSPLVVVGPCLMSSGGTLFLYLVFQWFLCRPMVK
ncbi:hypothetical protein O3P69_020137 [Scylla paramamosain]|uniref:Uncharacterized protein n=1 Tax=Scylla paramamosain TaxID=85552 RepID=A0AAW0TKV6_SCYPA